MHGKQAGRQECHLELLRDCLCCLSRLVLLCQLSNLALYLREDVLLQPLNQHLQAKSHSASCFQDGFEQHASSKMQMTVRMRKLDPDTLMLHTDQASLPRMLAINVLMASKQFGKLS